MPTYFVRLTVYDPEVMAALESLKRSRKQSAFVVEALRQLLSAENGQQLLRSMTGEAKPAHQESIKKKAGTLPSPVSQAAPTDLDDIFRR